MNKMLTIQQRNDVLNSMAQLIANEKATIIKSDNANFSGAILISIEPHLMVLGKK